MATTLTLNARSCSIADRLAAQADVARVSVMQTSAGARSIDCGIRSEGGLVAGIALARICLADLAEVQLIPGEVDDMPCLQVQVRSDQPVLACMASQYAGWAIQVGGKFIGMGSGPMRAAYGKEAIFDHLADKESPDVAVGVIETRKLPDDELVQYLIERVKVPADKLTLLVAPASSQAGTVQVVARSLETALHKLHELKFDLSQVVSGCGLAPLPPVTPSEIAAIGRTNDAILYGGRVILWVRADDEELAALGPQIPSSASPDHGAPFATIFERYGGDFYKIDPLLFSPAQVVFCNLNSGRTHSFGRLEPGILKRSFIGVE